ncbi:hypothetical protein MASR1M45_06530 [Candidatus Kapaibacterium sp.]
MTITVKLFMQNFIFTGIPFGLFYGILMMGFDLLEGNRFSFWKFILLSFFYGTAMSLFFFYMKKYRLKKMGLNDITDQNFGVRHSKRFNSKLSLSEIKNKLISDVIFKKMKLSEIENGLFLKSKMDWYSWGEEIRIIQQSNNGSDFDYQLICSPRFKATLFDFGKNIENIKRIEKLTK